MISNLSISSYILFFQLKFAIARTWCLVKKFLEFLNVKKKFTVTETLVLKLLCFHTKRRRAQTCLQQKACFLFTDFDLEGGS